MSHHFRGNSVMICFANGFWFTCCHSAPGWNDARGRKTDISGTTVSYLSITVSALHKTERQV